MKSFVADKGLKKKTLDQKSPALVTGLAAASASAPEDPGELTGDEEEEGAGIDK